MKKNTEHFAKFGIIDGVCKYIPATNYSIKLTTQNSINNFSF
jgi:hypothetical protein